MTAREQAVAFQIDVAHDLAMAAEGRRQLAIDANFKAASVANGHLKALAIRCRQGFSLPQHAGEQHFPGAGRPYLQPSIRKRGQDDTARGGRRRFLSSGGGRDIAGLREPANVG